MRWKFRSLLGSALARRYSDGGAAPAGETGGSAAGTPAAGAGAASGTDPTPPKAPEQTPPKPEQAPPKPEQASPKKEVEAPKAEQSAKTYTDADLETARQKAVEEYKRHLQEATDYNKMTPEEKVAHLEKQMAEEKLARYTADALMKAGTDASLAVFVKGADEKDTDDRVKAFKEVFDKAVQAGVEARFKGIGYTPRAGGMGSPSAEAEKKPRGVSVK